MMWWARDQMEHLMSDLERMKTSLYLTDVVVLCHDVDTVNFSGLETPRRAGASR